MQEYDRFDLADTSHEKLPLTTISRLRVRALPKTRKRGKLANDLAAIR
jgi:hypothetical protein